MEMVKIDKFIQGLTSDEDQRQELWYFFLQNGNLETLSNHLDRIKIEEKVHNNFKYLVDSILQKPLSPLMEEAMLRLSEVEKSIVCLLACGLTLEEVAKYKNISLVRVRAILYNIRSSAIWSTINNLENCDVKNKT